MEILFENKNVIVCVKPGGILSQADCNGAYSMISLLEEHTGSPIFPLHRLDKEVGGVMVYAKTRFAAAALSRDISEHDFKKEYYAFVHGRPEPESGEMRDLLFKDSRKNKSFVVKRERKGVKEAKLEYKIIKSFDINKETFSVVSVLLHTGRTHQIRVQFASRKMPLAGDRKYGANDNFNSIGLWSHCIGFSEPETKEYLEFKAEPENIIINYI